MENNATITINALQHVGIPVTDIVLSESFYSRLGFKKVMQAPFDMDGETGTCIMLQFGSVLIELYQMPEKRIDEVRKRKDGHIDHIAFDVTDIGSTFSALKDAGFHILEEGPVFLAFWKRGCRYFNILGPDRERLEFNQVL